jgi:hypothetical protein
LTAVSVGNVLTHPPTRILWIATAPPQYASAARVVSGSFQAGSAAVVAGALIVMWNSSDSALPDNLEPASEGADWTTLAIGLSVAATWLGWVAFLAYRLLDA